MKTVLNIIAFFLLLLPIKKWIAVLKVKTFTLIYVITLLKTIKTVYSIAGNVIINGRIANFGFGLPSSVNLSKKETTTLLKYSYYIVLADWLSTVISFAPEVNWFWWACDEGYLNAFRTWATFRQKLHSDESHFEWLRKKNK